jgi:hypothetical protein
VLSVAGKFVPTPRGSGAKHRRPRRPAPEGGGSASPASPWSRRYEQEKGKRERGGLLTM